jgi:hypothetical protein
MTIGPAWEVLNRKWITRVQLERKATNGINSAHLSKKSGMITLTPSWDEIMSAPWMVWGQKPKMSKTPENHGEQYRINVNKPFGGFP